MPWTPVNASTDVGQIAIMALGKLGARLKQKAIVERLKDCDQNVRLTTLLALERLGVRLESKDIQAIASLVDDPEERV